MTDRAPPGHERSMTMNALTSASALLVVPLAPEDEPVESAPTDPVRRFRSMYDAHVDFVWRNLRRFGVPVGDVDDRTQEVFIVAHRRFGEFEERGYGPRAWLFQIALRVASDARRSRRRHPEDPDGGAAQERVSTEPVQARDLARREALNTLDRALEAIEVGRRAVLVLHEIEEMSAPEIAQSLGIPLNTVYSRLRTARIELEASLRRSALKSESGGAR